MRDYKPSLVDEQFRKTSKISREDARNSKPKTNQVIKIKSVTKYNPRLPKTDGFIKKHISILHSDDALKKSYFIRGQLNCERINVIYSKTCSKCLEQYAGSAVKFKTRFRIHKSDIKTEKERCRSARHFNSKSYHDTNPFQYLKVQLIEQVQSNNLEHIEEFL